MERRPFQPPQSEGAFFAGFLQIALGVFVGGLLSIFAYEAIVEWRIEQAARKALAKMEAEIQRANADAAQQARAREALRRQQEEQAASRRAALDMAARLERERRERKEAAWKKYFTPSSACQADSGTAACANEYMAAKKRFEAAYTDR